MAGFAALCMAPQTFGLKQYRKVLASYEQGVEKPVDQKLLDIADDVRFWAVTACFSVPTIQAGVLEPVFRRVL